MSIFHHVHKMWFSWPEARGIRKGYRRWNADSPKSRKYSDWWIKQTTCSSCYCSMWWNVTAKNTLPNSTLSISNSLLETKLGQLGIFSLKVFLEWFWLLKKWLQVQNMGWTSGQNFSHVVELCLKLANMILVLDLSLKLLIKLKIKIGFLSCQEIGFRSFADRFQG